MNPKCPACRAEIPLADVNVNTDIALCRACGKTSSYAELLQEQDAGPVDLQNPPKGAWFRQDMTGFEAGATTRSVAALFLVPFMCVWSGFSLGGIYGSQILRGQFNLTMSLFGIPFVLGTLLFGSLALMTVCGKVEVRVRGNEGVVFTGVGPIGWRRRFEWDGVTSIRLTERIRQHDRPAASAITIEGRKPLAFATGIKAERQRFLLAVLRQMRRQHR